MNTTRAAALLALALLVPVTATAQDDAFSLDGLVITASPTPLEAELVASHVTILTAEDLSAAGDRMLGEALRDVAGLGVVRNGSFGAATSVFLRGGESDYTLVLVDGVQVNQAGGGFDFSTLTTDNIERVEIVRGPASALYGSDAVTGVVHIVTRTGRGAPRVDASLVAGSFGRRDVSASVGAGSDRVGYSLAVSQRSSDGVLAFNNAHDATVLSGRVRFLPDTRTEVGLSLRATDQRYHFPTDGSGAVVDRNAYTFSDAAQLRVDARRSVGERLSLEAFVAVHELDGGLDDRQDGPADTLGFYGFASLDDFQRATAELRGHLTLDEGVVTFGFEGERERQRSFTASESEFGPSNGRSEHERTNRAGFVHVAGSSGPLSLTGGGRLEDNERFGRFLTWQAGLSWLAVPRTRTRLRASAGTGIKEPTFAENFATGFAVGNPDLDPERSRSWEVGVEQPLAADRVVVRATWFDQRFRDLIQYTFLPPSPTDPNYFNVAEATSRGVEVAVDGDLGPVSVGLTHSRLDTEVVDAGFDEGPGATFVAGESLLRRPERSWGVRAAATLTSSLRVRAHLSHVGERSDRDFSTFPASPVELSAYTTVSLGGEVDVPTGALSRLSLSVRVENLLDAAYQEALGFSAPGRALYLGARVGLGG